MGVSEEQTRLQIKLVEYRRELHENPELSMQEFETTKRIRHWLEDAGITILDYPLEVGIVAEISGGEPGPTIALRADIDALPIKEETGYRLPLKMRGLCMHVVMIFTHPPLSVQRFFYKNAEPN